MTAPAPAGPGAGRPPAGGHPDAGAGFGGGLPDVGAGARGGFPDVGAGARGGSRPLLGRGALALAVFGGGALVGGSVGLQFVVVTIGVPDLAAPSDGGVPQTGFLLIGMLVALATGGLIGGAAGGAAAGALALGGAAGLPRWAVGASAATIAAGVTITLVAWLAGWNSETAALSLYAAAHAAVGAIAAAGVGPPPRPAADRRR